VLVPGPALDNDLARDFIRDVLMERYQTSLLLYDERYFSAQADDLSEDGMTVVEMHQGEPEMECGLGQVLRGRLRGDRPQGPAQRRPGASRSRSSRSRGQDRTRLAGVEDRA
jgi:hypothetical protein